MHLTNGENIVLRCSKIRVSSKFNYFAISSDGKVFLQDSRIPFDLNQLEREGITEIEFLSNRVDTFTLYDDIDQKICSNDISPEPSSYSVGGRLYFYQNREWRYRAVNISVGSEAKVKERYGVRTQSTSVIPSTQTYQQSSNPVNEGKLKRLGQFVIPRSVNNLHVEFNWKSHTSKTGILQKIVASQTLNVNMDLSIALFDSNLNLLDMVSAYNERSRNSSVYHYGDKTEGLNSIGSEMASMSLRNLDPNVKFISIGVTSKEDHRFNLIEHSSLKLKNQEGMIPLTEFEFQNKEDKPGCFVGLLTRQLDDSWKFVVIEDYILQARTPNELVETFQGWVKLMNLA